MTDVTIAAEIAQEMAEYHREFAPGEAAVRSASWHQMMADLLDPKPPTLREKVADALLAYDSTWTAAEAAEGADRVRAVIADEMAKRPLGGPQIEGTSYYQTQRDADVAWLRGEQS